MKRLGILIIRGSGMSGFDAQEKFLGRLWKCLEKDGVDSSQIAYHFVDWYSVLDTGQVELLRRLEEQEELKVKSWPLRRFLITNITDLINYGGRPNQPSDVYDKIHAQVHRDIQTLQGQLLENSPLIILSSSMGTEIINNHIWDRQQWATKNPGTDDPLGGTPFERMETLLALYAYGNNIPIFATSRPLDSLQPIAFPGSAISPDLQPHSKWENIYDKNDPMGYPIKFLNANYQNAPVVDKQINVGDVLTFWNLASHLKYWNSKRLVRRLNDYIVAIWPKIEPAIA